MLFEFGVDPQDPIQEIDVVVFGEKRGEFSWCVIRGVGAAAKEISVVFGEPLQAPVLDRGRRRVVVPDDKGRRM